MRVYLLLTLLLPFLGAFALAVLGRYLRRRVVEIIACGSVVLSFSTSLLAFFSSSPKAQTLILFPWIYTEGFRPP